MKSRVLLKRMASTKTFQFSCLQCDDPCEGVDPKILSSIDTTKPLLGSVKPYKHHFVFSLPSPWPTNLDTDKDQRSDKFQTLSKLSKDLSGRCLVSAGEGVSESEILEFPSRLVYSCPNTSSLESDIRTQKGSPLQSLAHILVCVHKSRDARCGALGPLIVESFQSQIRELGLEKRVFVYGISHIGGHAFAGNCIVYHEQEALNGHWYGRVKPSHTKQILQDHILNGKIIKELWRGHYMET